MPWEMMVDSSATTGLPASIAAFTSGDTSRYLDVYKRQVYVSAEGDVPEALRPRLLKTPYELIHHVLAFSGNLWCYFKGGEMSPWRLMTTYTDAPSGFRAYSREGALRLNVVNDYSYTCLLYTSAIV